MGLEMAAACAKNGFTGERSKRETMNLNGYDGRWCAVQVRPRHEVFVSTMLRSKGYEEFLPLSRTKRQWSDRAKQIETPLFPGYVFCRLNPGVCGAIVTTPGVMRLVGTRKEVAVIEDHEIEAIQRIVNSSLKAEPCMYTIGDRLRFATGPFEGIEGVVTRYNNQRCLVVSIDLIQSSISVEIGNRDWGCLVKAMPPLQQRQSQFSLH